MSSHDLPGLSRREIVKAAIAIGGTNALAACLDYEGDRTEKEANTEFPQGPSDLSSLPDRQHAWGRYVVHDIHGNTVLPQHQVLLFLNYTGSDPPTEAERSTVEKSLRTLERAYQYGTGGNISAAINRGLLTMLGYSPSYFDRYEEALPDGIDLARPETVLSRIGENPNNAVQYDALLVLTADFGSILLSAEEVLFGKTDMVNGIEVTATLNGVFEKAERRTGVVGKGLPAQKLDSEQIPDSAPLSMGFKSGFKDNIPPEDKVTIRSGPFAEGTTLQASRLMIDIDQWYEQDQESRVKEMFSPDHTVDDVGQTAETLGDDSGITEQTVENIEEHAAKHGCVGHSQKTATVRDDDFDPLILRRSESVATDITKEGKAGFNFVSVQTGIDDFIKTRKAMNPEEYDLDIEDPHHGIVNFFEAESRATFLVPPREQRALPQPTGDQVEQP